MIWRIGDYFAEHHKNEDTFVLRITYAYNLKVHQTTQMPPFSREITTLPPGCVNMARTMPLARPQKNKFTLRFQPRLTPRGALVGKIRDKHTRKAKQRYKNDYE